MATPTASREQQSAQTGLIVLMLREIAGTWRLLEPAQLAHTMPRWIRAVRAIIDRYAQAGGAMALDYYDAERDAAGVPGRAPATLLREPDPDQLVAGLRWATKNLWGRDVLDQVAAIEAEIERIAREEEAADLAAFDEQDLAEVGKDRLEEDTEDAVEPGDGVVRQIQAARAKVDGITSRLVADVGRGAVIDSVAADPAAVAVARLARPDACAFCRVMAIRGAVYKDEQAAGRGANAKFVGAGEFKYHDHCRCWASPLFDGEEWQPQPEVELWQRQYEQARSMGGDTVANFYRLLRVS